jgi:hypothetical protein
MRIPFITLIAGGALALGGCAYGDLGLGMGYGDSYGGYGYGSPYYGWYDNYYYPGTGMYVYDSYRRPRIWNDRQRNYWSSRIKTSGTRMATTNPNWSGFSTRSTVSDTNTMSSRQQRMVVRQQQQQARQENRRQHDHTPQ